MFWQGQTLLQDYLDLELRAYKPGVIYKIYSAHNTRFDRVSNKQFSISSAFKWHTPL